MVEWAEGSLNSDIWRHVLPSNHLESIILPLSITTPATWILKIQVTKCALLEECFDVKSKNSAPRFSWQSKIVYANMSAKNHHHKHVCKSQIVNICLMMISLCLHLVQWHYHNIVLNTYKIKYQVGLHDFQLSGSRRSVWLSATCTWLKLSCLFNNTKHHV